MAADTLKEAIYQNSEVELSANEVDAIASEIRDFFAHRVFVLAAHFDDTHVNLLPSEALYALFESVFKEVPAAPTFANHVYGGGRQ